MLESIDAGGGAQLSTDKDTDKRMTTDVDHRREYPLSVYPIKHPLMADNVGIARRGWGRRSSSGDASIDLSDSFYSHMINIHIQCAGLCLMTTGFCHPHLAKLV
jgi:hypothetical protein